MRSGRSSATFTTTRNLSDGRIRNENHHHNSGSHSHHRCGDSLRLLRRSQQGGQDGAADMEEKAE